MGRRRWPLLTDGSSAPSSTAMDCVLAALFTTVDGLVVMASEAGVLPIKPEDVRMNELPSARPDAIGGY